MATHLPMIASLLLVVVTVAAAQVQPPSTTHLPMIAASVTVEPQRWGFFKYYFRQVVITNDLEGREDLLVHCKDAHKDFGSHVVTYGQSYAFRFRARGIVDDYYCGFVFNGKLHWFDIYLGKRDNYRCGGYNLCSWLIKEGQPCVLYPPESQTFYHWKPAQHKTLP